MCPRLCSSIHSAGAVFRSASIEDCSSFPRRRCSSRLWWTRRTDSCSMRNPENRAHMEQLLDSDDLDTIVSGVGSRKDRIRDHYQAKLSTVAKFVRYFEMRNEQDRVIYYLFFAGNHRTGHYKMKDSFWAVDQTGRFRFSDATSRSQPVLFDLDPAPQLVPILESEFAGRVVSGKEVTRFV